MVTLDRIHRVTVLVFAALLLGLLVVVARDGITVGGGVFSLLCFGLLMVAGVVLVCHKVAERSREEGEDFSLVLTIVIAVLMLPIVGGAYLAKLYETEGVDVGKWFPLSNFSPLTLLGPVLIMGFLVVGVVGTYIEKHLGRWKTRVIAQRRDQAGG